MEYITSASCLIFICRLCPLSVIISIKMNVNDAWCFLVRKPTVFTYTRICLQHRPATSNMVDALTYCGNGQTKIMRCLCIYVWWIK